MVAEQPGVPVGSALLQAAAHLADEAVHVDHEPAGAWPGARLPGPLERTAQQRVELPDVPERERAQERPQCRGRRHPAAQQPPRPTRPQQLAVIDAVRAQHHRKQQRHHLAARVRGARPIPAQPHQPPGQSLDPEPLGERRHQHHTRVRDSPFIVELDRQAVHGNRLFFVHHLGDLLTPGPGCP